MSGTRGVSRRGAQHERTDLAWGRTAAGMLIASALLLRIGALAGGEAAFLPAILFAATGLLSLVLAERGSIGPRARGRSASLPLYAVAISTVLFGLVASGLVVMVTR